MQYDMSDNFAATLTCSLETIIDSSFHHILIFKCVLQNALAKVRLRRENRSLLEFRRWKSQVMEYIQLRRGAVRASSRYQI